MHFYMHSYLHKNFILAKMGVTKLNHRAANEVLRVNSRWEPRHKQDPLAHGWPDQNQWQTKLAGCEAWHMLRSKTCEKRCSGKSDGGNREPERSARRQKEAEKSSTEWGTRAVKKISAGQTQIQRRGTSTGRDKDHTKNKQEK
jgi:hypothetical protein